MNAVAGQEYKIKIQDNAETVGFPFTIALNQFLPPVNDNFANATVLGNTLNDLEVIETDVIGTTLGASKETSEPNHASGFGTSGPSVWYKFIAPSNGTFRFDIVTATDASDPYASTDEICIAAYQGSVVTNLTTVKLATAVNTGIGFSCNLGQTYYIAVAGSTTSSCDFRLRMTFGDTPSNDNFVNAIDLGSNTNVVVRGHNIAATIEHGEPNAGDTGNEFNSVWYRWTVPKTGYCTFTINSGITHLLRWYVGLDKVEEITPDNTGGAKSGHGIGVITEFYPLFAGRVLFIKIAGNGSSQRYGGAFTLTISI
jgi:hypothetical protein